MDPKTHRHYLMGVFSYGAVKYNIVTYASIYTNIQYFDVDIKEITKEGDCDNF